jgi:hypothetical protein
MARIYLSSTYEDLKTYRAAVCRILRKAMYVSQVVGMEDYVAADQRPLERCLADVSACDAYVGIFAWRYGYVPDKDNPDQKSITELEYRRAAEKRMPCLIFLLDPEKPWPRKLTDELTGEGHQGSRIKDLREELRKERLVSSFQEPEELAGLVSAAVFNALKPNLHSPNLTPTAAAVSQPREVSHDALLLYAEADEEFAVQWAKQFDMRRRRLLLSPRTLFAREPNQFHDLEHLTRQCHTAVIVLSDATATRLTEHAEQTRRVLGILQDRTGYVLVLGRTATSLGRAAEWDLANTLDVSRWDPEGYSSEQLALVTQVDQAITTHRGGGTTVGLPFTVIAMNSEEAQELDQPEDRLRATLGKDFEEFDRLKKTLAAHGSDPFVQRYGLTREEWKPFIGSPCTVRRALDEIAHHLNDRGRARLRGGPARIKLQYYPFDPVVRAEKELSAVYMDVARTGCVVLVDEFSTFHPLVTKAFFGSPLSVSRQVALVTISPFEPPGSVRHPTLEAELKRRLADVVDQLALELDYDPQFEFGVSNERRLKRWLHSSLPQALQNLREPRPDPERVKRFQQDQGGGQGPSVADVLFS